MTAPALLLLSLARASLDLSRPVLSLDVMVCLLQSSPPGIHGGMTPDGIGLARQESHGAMPPGLSTGSPACSGKRLGRLERLIPPR